MSIHCPFSKAFEVKASYIKLFKRDCQHSAVICIVKSACSGRRKDTGSSPPPPPTSTTTPSRTSSGYLLGSALEKRAGNLSMIPALRGEGPLGTCFISTTHLSFSVPPHTPTPPDPLIPLSFLPQASLFKFPCCQPTLAKRHSLPVSWLNCWRCLLLLGNPLRSFVPSAETHLHNSLCKPEIPSVSFPSFSSAFSLPLSLSPSNRWWSKAGELLIDSHTLTTGQQW